MKLHAIQNNSRPGIMVMLLTVAMTVCVLAVGYTVMKLMENASDENEWMRLATGVQVDSQKLSKSASEAALGILDAFDHLTVTHREMANNMRILNAGSDEMGLPPLPMEVAPQVSDLVLNWNRMSNSAASIINRKVIINDLAEASSQFLSVIPQIQASTDRGVRQLIEAGSPNPQVFVASNQMVLADRMLRRVNEILQNGTRSAQAADDLRTEMAQFESVQSALAGGNQRMGVTPVRNQQALRTLGQIRRQYESAKPHLEAILTASPKLFELRGAADEIFLESEDMFVNAGALAQAVSELPRSRLWPSWQSASIGMALLLILVAIAIALVIVGARRRADDALQNNSRTQKAIMRLLDELGSLADGDLTTHATVTDEITGAIADAVNYAVEQLRDLVTGINHTANAVADTAENTRRSTSKLASAANKQAKQVDEATGKIKEVSSAFTTLAERSKESRESAMESVNTAHSGAEKVRKTIHGMDTIREQIQETSKRIKRLGESTQEIGNIVSMINDIAEQTNVLALNAAIQAASAGSSGSGFAVVADEVQQLAESATNATRRITSLVQTIQIDTGEAVKSMESTTTEVVNGARLAQDAGKALVHIEEESKQLSSLIEEIANEAISHSEQAGRISDLMDKIRKVSVDTSEGTAVTASEVAELADLVMQLRQSVDDFKLPQREDTVVPLAIAHQS